MRLHCRSVQPSGSGVSRCAGCACSGSSGISLAWNVYQAAQENSATSPRTSAAATVRTGCGRVRWATATTAPASTPTASYGTIQSDGGGGRTESGRCCDTR